SNGDRDVALDVTVEGPRLQQYQKGTPKQIEVQRTASQRTAASPVGLGLRESPPSTQGVPRPRPQSVSFKEPFDRARPVDEWRAGKVARLTLADQVLDSVAVPRQDKDRAWWENEEDTSKRRRSSRTSDARAPDVIDDRHAEFKPPLYLKCGPLL